MDVSSAQASDLIEGGVEQVGAHVMPGRPMVGPNHELEAPRVMTTTQLGVADQTAIGAVAGDESGEARPASVDEIEPLVFAKRAVPVGRRHLVKKVRYFSDVGLTHPPLDLHMMHCQSRYRARSVTGFGSLPPMSRPRSLRGRAREVATRLAGEYPGSATDLCALRHDGPFQLLVATILSAQSTDERVNMVTPELFAAYPTPEALAAAPPGSVEELIHSTGFFRAKTRSLLGMARAVVELHGGRVPSEMDQLVKLPGVGRKTANVVRSVAFELPGLPVDTHVGRIVRRLGLTTQSDPVKVESEICAMLPLDEWGAFSLRLILHGRRVCLARRPRCSECLLVDLCPSAELPIGTRPGVSPATRRTTSPTTPSPRGRQGVPRG